MCCTHTSPYATFSSQPGLVWSVKFEHDSSCGILLGAHVVHSIVVCSQLRLVGYEASVATGRMSQVQATGKFSYRKIDKKLFCKFNKANSVDGCARLYGPSICQTTHKAWFKDLKFIHKQLWQWVSQSPSWTDNTSEGKFLVVLTAECTDNQHAPQELAVFLSRRLGNPRRMIFTKCRNEGHSLVLRHLQTSHVTSFELAWLMLTVHGQPDPDSGAVRCLIVVWTSVARVGGESCNL